MVLKEEDKVKLYLSSYKLGNATEELKKWLQNSCSFVLAKENFSQKMHHKLDLLAKTGFSGGLCHFPEAGMPSLLQQAASLTPETSVQTRKAAALSEQPSERFRPLERPAPADLGQTHRASGGSFRRASSSRCPARRWQWLPSRPGGPR